MSSSFTSSTGTYGQSVAISLLQFIISVEVAFSNPVKIWMRSISCIERRMNPVWNCEVGCITWSCTGASITSLKTQIPPVLLWNVYYKPVYWRSLRQWRISPNQTLTAPVLMPIVLPTSHIHYLFLWTVLHLNSILEVTFVNWSALITLNILTSTIPQYRWNSWSGYIIQRSFEEDRECCQICHMLM